MTIKQVSEKYGISADTLRYYEKTGLIPDVPRTPGGIRDYDETACGWVEFIMCMRNAGLPIDVLSKYVELCKQGDGTAEERKQILIRQREQLIEKIESLNASLERLDFKINYYDEVILKRERELKDGIEEAF
ncbi:MAG: MerR family transcriptional regulator [Oscillospiraceae bacterium]|nr:MerR family transcriptional regulator [Oscillospiraceae bacterium]